MYFEQNAQALLQLRASNQKWVTAVNAAPPVSEDDILLLPTPDGDCAFRYQGIWLHSETAPVDEVRRVFEKNCQSKTDQAHVILGLGLGYALDEVLKLSSSLAVIVYEPDLSLLRFTLENVDLQTLLSNNRVHLYTTQEDLLDFLNHLIHGYFSIDSLILPGMAKRFSAEIPQLSREINHLIVDWARNYHSLKRFHPLWWQRFFENLQYLVTIPALDDLADYYRGKSALIISRGPSLDAAIEDVAALQRSAVLVAVGAALHRLHAANIVPDFAVFYDMNGMDEQLHGLPESYLNQITLVVSPFVRHVSMDYPSRDKRLLLCDATKTFGTWLNTALQTSHSRISGGGSVSIAALQLAMLLGCTEITLIGQDLAFPNDQVYAGGITVQKDDQGRLDLQHSETLFIAEAMVMSTIRGQHGETLSTLEAFTTYARQLVALAQKVSLETPAIRLFNASIGGAQLDGYELQPLSAFRDHWTEWKTEESRPPVLRFDELEQKRRQGLLLHAVQETSRTLSDAQAFFKKLKLSLLRILSGKLKSPAVCIQLEDTVWIAVSQLVQFVNEQPLIEYVLQFEIAPFKQRFRTYREAFDFQPEIAQELADFLQKLMDELDQFDLAVKHSKTGLSESSLKPVNAMNP